MPKLHRRDAVALLTSTVTGILLSSSSANQDAPGGIVTGRVIDTEGEAIANATVTVTHQSTCKGYVAKTDSGGVYRFTNLPPGKYRMSWWHEAARAMYETPPQGWFRPDPERDVRPGETTEVPGRIMRLWTTLKLKVRLSGNLPASNQTVYFVGLPSSGGCFPPFGGSIRHLRTDAVGTCLVSLDLGDQPIEFLNFAHEETGQFAMTPVAAKPGGTRTVTVRLVKEAVVQGVVISADGRTPCPGQTVLASVAEPSSRSERVTTHECEALMRDVAALQYEGEEERLNWEGDTGTINELVLQHREWLNVFTVVSEPRAPLSQNTGGRPTSSVENIPQGLAGAVRNPAGNGYKIVRYTRSTVTDASGNFQFKLFPGLTYEIHENGFAEEKPFRIHTRSGQTRNGAILMIADAKSKLSGAVPPAVAASP